MSIDVWTRYEDAFSRNLYSGAAGETDPSFLRMEGSLPVLASAPHAVNHYREDRLKVADLYTGTLAMALHASTGCHAIVSSRTTVDPNWAIGGPYKEEVGRIVRERGIRYVLDLHGSSDARPFDVDLGTMRGVSMSRAAVSRIRELFLEAGFERVEIDHSFPATHPGTVTSYAHRELGVQSIQIEIARAYRDPERPERFLRTVRALEQAVAYLNASARDNLDPEVERP